MKCGALTPMARSPGATAPRLRLVAYTDGLSASTPLPEPRGFVNTAIISADYHSASIGPVPTPSIDTSQASNPAYKEDDMATESDLRRAEISAAEARTDTKIVRLEGKI